MIREDVSDLFSFFGGNIFGILSLFVFRFAESSAKSYLGPCRIPLIQHDSPSRFHWGAESCSGTNGREPIQDPPFSDLAPMGPEELFVGSEVDRICDLLAVIRERAEPPKAA
jgi:hypothetical protein